MERSSDVLRDKHKRIDLLILTETKNRQGLEILGNTIASIDAQRNKMVKTDCQIGIASMNSQEQWETKYHRLTNNNIYGNKLTMFNGSRQNYR